MLSTRKLVLERVELDLKLEEMKLRQEGSTVKPSLKGRAVGGRQIPSGSSEASKNTRGALGVGGWGWCGGGRE